jgi:hypothetical protein
MLGKEFAPCANSGSHCRIAAMTPCRQSSMRGRLSFPRRGTGGAFRSIVARCAFMLCRAQLLTAIGGFRSPVGVPPRVHVMPRPRKAPPGPSTAGGVVRITEWLVKNKQSRYYVLS